MTIAPIDIAVLVNPHSGGEHGRKLLDLLERHRGKNPPGLSVAALDWNDLDRQLAEARLAKLILVAGGDGTLSSIFARLTEPDARQGPPLPPVGVLPLGTGNDLARELRLHNFFSWRAIADSLRRYQKLDAKPLTIWNVAWGVNLEYSAAFCNYLSCGFDAAVVRRFAGYRAKRSALVSRLGVSGNRLLYAAAAARELRCMLPTLEIECVDRPVALAENLRSIVFANIRSVLGLGQSNRQADPFDRQIEIVAVRRVSGYLDMCLGARNAWLGHEMKGRASQIDFCLPSTVAVQLDGEARPDITGPRMCISPRGSVMVLVGPAAGRDDAYT